MLETHIILMLQIVNKIKLIYYFFILYIDSKKLYTNVS